LLMMMMMMTCFSSCAHSINAIDPAPHPGRSAFQYQLQVVIKVTVL
jgi:hypothetical protein